jgi:hypothetical protein
LDLPPNSNRFKVLQKEISDLWANMSQHRIDFELKARKARAFSSLTLQGGMDYQ